MKKADLIISFKGMPFMDKAGSGGGAQLSVDTQGHNWMAPDFYIYGVGLLADRLSERYPEDKAWIMGRRKNEVERVRSEADKFREKIAQAGTRGKAVIASSMQKEVLQWMGFSVVGEYGRPEAMSARDVVQLSKVGKDRRAILVVDNLQSGPDAGKGIAEALRVPHVVLTNFPSERGYIVALAENVDAVLAATRK
jgi:zinc transport system substrate-binding protein